MSNKTTDKILGNVLKGIGVLAFGAIVGKIVGDTHSNINENERREDTNKLERNINISNKSEVRN